MVCYGIGLMGLTGLLYVQGFFCGGLSFRAWGLNMFISGFWVKALSVYVEGLSVRAWAFVSCCLQSERLC